jgi:hypothetical protein
MNPMRVRAFIDEAYLRSYDARIPAGFGDYLVFHDGADERAALGYRRAGEDVLFLERYLDLPVEQAVTAALGRQIARDRIIEIGNLAANNAWAMIALWGRAANDLGASSEVVVATLTGPLRRMFARVGVPVCELAPADPTRLGARAGDWGSYYCTDPWVCAGSIAEGQRAIAAFMARRRSIAA